MITNEASMMSSIERINKLFKRLSGSEKVL